jgi:hypothetical protein
MLAYHFFVIASPTGRGNPDGEVVSAAHSSAGLPRFDNARLSVLSLRALPGVAIQSGASCALPMLRLDCHVGTLSLLAMTRCGGWFGWIAASGCRPPRNDRVWRVGGREKEVLPFHFVIASPYGRGNPVGGVVCAALGSAGLPRRDFVPPRNDRERGVKKGAFRLDCRVGTLSFIARVGGRKRKSRTLSDPAFSEKLYFCWALLASLNLYRDTSF